MIERRPKMTQRRQKIRPKALKPKKAAAEAALSSQEQVAAEGSASAKKVMVQMAKRSSNTFRVLMVGRLLDL